MDRYGYHSISIHSIANAFQWTGMDTIAMDTYPFVAGAVRAVGDVFTRQDPALRRARTAAVLRDERFRGLRWSGKRRWREPLVPHLRTPVRCAIITIIAHLSTAKIRLRRPAHDHHHRRPRRPTSARARAQGRRPGRDPLAGRASSGPCIVDGLPGILAPAHASLKNMEPSPAK